MRGRSCRDQAPSGRARKTPAPPGTPWGQLSQPHPLGDGVKEAGPAGRASQLHPRQPHAEHTESWGTQLGAPTSPRGCADSGEGAGAFHYDSDSLLDLSCSGSGGDLGASVFSPGRSERQQLTPAGSQASGTWKRTLRPWNGAWPPAVPQLCGKYRQVLGKRRRVETAREEAVASDDFKGRPLP